MRSMFEMNRDDWYAGDVDDNHYMWHHQFDNGYGASVVSKYGTYGWSDGLFEVAVTHGKHLCYRSPVTSDVEGYRTFAEVGEILASIEALPKRRPEMCSHNRRSNTWD